jgi:hypothetical protein
MYGSMAGIKHQARGDFGERDQSFQSHFLHQPVHAGHNDMPLLKIPSPQATVMPRRTKLPCRSLLLLKP